VVAPFACLDVIFNALTAPYTLSWQNERLTRTHLAGTAFVSLGAVMTSLFANVDNKVYNVKVGPNDAYKGNKNAKITIVEFSEFQCPFCSRVNPTISRIMKEYGDKVRVVFKHNPLSFHKDAPLAAQASLAAGKQGKFWAMHDIMFKNQRKLKPDNLNSYAKEIGLDMAKFATDLNSDALKKQVADDMAQAKQLKARGTPHFFVNGRRLAGAQPFDRFKALIDEMLKK
jgi:protein-disulfide isomerase